MLEVICFVLRQFPEPGSQLTTIVFCGTRMTVAGPLNVRFCFFSACCSVGSNSLVGVGPAITRWFASNRYHCAGVPLSASARVSGAFSRSKRLPIATGTFCRPVVTEGPVRSFSKS